MHAVTFRTSASQMALAVTRSCTCLFAPRMPERRGVRFQSTCSQRIDMQQTIREQTALCSFPDIEIQLRLMTSACPLWTKSLRDAPFPEPWWGFLWPGSYALSRWCLENPGLLRGKRVLDFATGCGASAIAARTAGGVSVVANDIDNWSLQATEINAELNGVTLEYMERNLVGLARSELENPDIVLAGDVLYEQDLAEQVTGWLSELSAEGVAVYVGDPGRHFLNKSKLQPIASYDLPQEIRDDNYGHQAGAVWQFR